MALFFDRRLVVFGVMLVAMVMLVGCGQGGDQATTAPESPSPAVQAATGGQEVTPYPLDVCIVSGEKLGSMGDPIAVVVDGRELKICCAGCRRALDADPAGHLAKLDAAIAASQTPEDVTDQSQSDQPGETDAS